MNYKLKNRYAKRINSLKKDLKKIIKRQRKSKEAIGKRIVNTSFALVGYTNSGKTTLFNKLTKKNEYAKDELIRNTRYKDK